MRVSALLLVVVVLLALSGAMAGGRLKAKLAAKTLAKADGNSCTYLGATQECSVWCSANCGGPCSSCESQSGNVCACDDIPAINDKKLIKADGNSCTYLGATQQCSVWCTENCGAPCSSCESESGAVCACDDTPAINTKKAAVWIRDPVGNSCSYLGETQECSEWCTDTCGAPCSTCAEGSNDVVCACDEIPAISDIKLDGNSCTYLGATQQCSVWCTENCGAPCSSCESESGAVCACDDTPAINTVKSAKWIKADGNSCSYLGVTQQCSEWCTNTCGAPCSACEIADGSVCACDDLPAINTAAAVWIRDPVGNSCSYLGETQECSEWCTDTCGAPCSTCAEGSNDVVCACDEIPAISDVAIKNGKKVSKKQ
jgi:hypothetical protein